MELRHFSKELLLSIAIFVRTLTLALMKSDNNARQLCSALKVDNLSIQEKINYSDSFLHTDSTNRGGRVYISNELYAFALSLEKLVEKDLHKSNLIIKGQHWLQSSFDNLYKNSDLYSNFWTSIHFSNVYCNFRWYHQNL